MLPSQFVNDRSTTPTHFSTNYMLNDGRDAQKEINPKKDLIPTLLFNYISLLITYKLRIILIMEVPLLINGEEFNKFILIINMKQLKGCFDSSNYK